VTQLKRFLPVEEGYESGIYFLNSGSLTPRQHRKNVPEMVTLTQSHPCNFLATPWLCDGLPLEWSPLEACRCGGMFSFARF